MKALSSDRQTGRQTRQTDSYTHTHTHTHRDIKVSHPCHGPPEKCLDLLCGRPCDCVRSPGFLATLSSTSRPPCPPDLPHLRRRGWTDLGSASRQEQAGPVLQHSSLYDHCFATSDLTAPFSARAPRMPPQRAPATQPAVSS